MITGLLVLKMVLMPSRHFLASLANSGPRWSIMGVSIARSTRSGSGVGPGICRKCRPTGRDEFLAIGETLLGEAMQEVCGVPRPVPGQGAVLAALNYECNIAVKQISARRTSRYA